MNFTRREFLAAGAATGAVSLAGCSGSCLQGLPIVGTNMPHDGAIATDRVDSLTEGATIIEFSELPKAEQSLLRTAVEKGVARACMTDESERGDALGSFSGRTSGESYLSFEGDHYGLWVRTTDVISASTADPPDGDANPCC